MRPQYHYTPRKNWLSDPNGLVHDGEHWHMCYQYNPHGNLWGHMAWGHAISADLVHWEEQVPALLEDDEHLIFSGSAVLDEHGSAGFGKGALVALYTGAVRCDDTTRAPSQVQCLAYSLDKGATWEKYSGNPILDYNMADFRDPFVFWHEASEKWVMVVALSKENAAIFLVSDDLKSWEETGRIDGHDKAGELWECPALIELPIEGGGTSWFFKVDALTGTAGAGAIYKTGSFDGRIFTPDGDEWLIVDHGNDFYAAVPWNGPKDEAGRPAWIGWMGNHAYQAKLPEAEWRGVMSLPRRIGLLRGAGGLRLTQRTLPSQNANFTSEHAFKSVLGTIPMASWVNIAAGFVGNVVIKGDEGQSLILETNAERLMVTRTDAMCPELDFTREIAWKPQGLTLFLDHETFELLSDDGTLAISLQHRLAGNEAVLEVSDAALITVASLL